MSTATCSQEPRTWRPGSCGPPACMLTQAGAGPRLGAIWWPPEVAVPAGERARHQGSWEVGASDAQDSGPNRAAEAAVQADSASW